MKNQHRNNARDEAGFTLLEVMVVVALMGVIAAMAIMVSPSFTKSARSDAGLSQLLDALRSAREVAISQRRNVRVQFIGLTAVQTRRIDIGVNGVQTGTTVLRTIELENRMQFKKEPGVDEDTGDQFGNANALQFSGPEPWLFTSEGTFVSGTGDPINGTITISIPDQKNSGRAVTIMGATALIRTWRWNGSEWVE